MKDEVVIIIELIQKLYDKKVDKFSEIKKEMKNKACV